MRNVPRGRYSLASLTHIYKQSNLGRSLNFVPERRGRRLLVAATATAAAAAGCIIVIVLLLLYMYRGSRSSGSCQLDLWFGPQDLTHSQVLNIWESLSREYNTSNIKYSLELLSIYNVWIQITARKRISTEWLDGYIIRD